MEVFGTRCEVSGSRCSSHVPLSVQLPGSVSVTCWWHSAMSTAAVTPTAAPRTSASSPPAPCLWSRECRNYQKVSNRCSFAFVRALSSPSDQFLPLPAAIPTPLSPVPTRQSRKSTSHPALSHSFLLSSCFLCSSLWVFRRRWVFLGEE